MTTNQLFFALAGLFLTMFGIMAVFLNYSLDSFKNYVDAKFAAVDAKFETINAQFSATRSEIRADREILEEKIKNIH